MCIVIRVSARTGVYSVFLLCESVLVQSLLVLLFCIKFRFHFTAFTNENVIQELGTDDIG